MSSLIGWVHTQNYPIVVSHDSCGWRIGLLWLLSHLIDYIGTYGLLMVYWLTCLSLDKMAAISQTTHSNAFSWMKNFVFWCEFHWSLFLRVQLTINQHWFGWWLGTKQAASYHLNQCLSSSLMHICNTRGDELNLWPVEKVAVILKLSFLYPCFTEGSDWSRGTLPPFMGTACQICFYHWLNLGKGISVETAWTCIGEDLIRMPSGNKP